MEYMRDFATLYVCALAIVTIVYGNGIMIIDFVKWLWKKFHKAKPPDREQQQEQGNN